MYRRFHRFGPRLIGIVILQATKTSFASSSTQKPPLSASEMSFFPCLILDRPICRQKRAFNWWATQRRVGTSKFLSRPVISISSPNTTRSTYCNVLHSVSSSHFYIFLLYKVFIYPHDAKSPDPPIKEKVKELRLKYHRYTIADQYPSDESQR
jgi:hypothetical protein